MDIVFMGTPDFAAVILKKLLGAPEFRVVAVVTQPDRPKGRGGKTAPPPVKELAAESGVPALQPEKLRDARFRETLKEFGADVFVVAAYGKILPEAALAIPALGCLCVHASLLPKYRGAAPIQRAVIDGAEKTGVTIMMMDKGIDTGDMILRAETAVSESDTYGSLQDRLAVLGADALTDALRLIKAGTAERTPQDAAAATYAPKITPEMERVNWEKTSGEISRLIRGLNPAPGAYSIYEGQKIKIWAAENAGASFAEVENAARGSVLGLSKRGFAVKTLDGALLVTEVQPQGGKKMSAGDYLRGHGVTAGGAFM